MLESTIKEKYDFENEPINIGEYGYTYIIRDKKVKTEYLLKKLLKKKIDNNKYKKTFEEELEFLINVKGKNIINIIDYYTNEKENYNYIILEKMDGDLDDMLNLEKYSKGMPSNLIKKIFSQFNFALKIMLEKKNISLPKYLKLSNILYSYTNEKKTDFVIKFGDLSLSRSSGSDMYKAPEISETNTNKCMLYSIGLILYKLKTNEYIFGGNDLLEILTNKKNNKIKSDTNDTILNKLIKKLVVLDPKNRMDWSDYFKDPFFNETENNDTQTKARIIYL